MTILFWASLLIGALTVRCLDGSVALRRFTSISVILVAEIMALQVYLEHFLCSLTIVQFFIPTVILCLSSLCFGWRTAALFTSMHVLVPGCMVTAIILSITEACWMVPGAFEHGFSTTLSGDGKMWVEYMQRLFSLQVQITPLIAAPAFAWLHKRFFNRQTPVSSFAELTTAVVN